MTVLTRLVLPVVVATTLACRPTGAAVTPTATVTPISCESVLVVGHRGYPGAGTDANTIPSFVRAAEAGFGAVETDLRLTRDHRVVLLHGPSVASTTNGRGLVSRLRYAKIRHLRTANGAQIPDIGALLAAMQPYPSLQLQLELKARFSPRQLRRLVRTLDRSGYAGRYMITSTDLTHLDVVKRVSPDVPTGFITYRGTVPDVARLARRGIPYALVNSRVFLRDDPAFLDRAAAAGVKVQARYLTPPQAAQLGIDRITAEQPLTCS